MTVLRTVIVDDEEPAREMLRNLLARWPQLTVVGEAADGLSAVELIQSMKPDLLFLDVQMPELNGFDVLADLASDCTPLVVFVTAYDQYALQAFEVSACDYLLKPFDSTRLARTIERVIARNDAENRGLTSRLQALLQDVLPAPAQIVVKTEGRHVFLASDDVHWIEAVGKDVRLHLTSRSIVARETMSALERRLDGRHFIRVHRSSIINRKHVLEIQPWFKGEYVVVLRSGARVVTGHTYRDSVLRLVGS